MGDVVWGSACDALINAFEDDLIKKFRSPLLDHTFGDRVRYFLWENTNTSPWSVELLAGVETGEIDEKTKESKEEFFRVDAMPVFFPGDNDTITEDIARALDIEDDEARRRYEKAEEEG
jgi:hypothetical protein